MFEIDAETGYAYFRICGGAIVESDEMMPGVIVDFDSKGTAVGIEWY